MAQNGTRHNKKRQGSAASSSSWNSKCGSGCTEERILTDARMVQVGLSSSEKRLKHQWEFDKCCVTPHRAQNATSVEAETSVIDSQILRIDGTTGQEKPQVHILIPAWCKQGAVSWIEQESPPSHLSCLIWYKFPSCVWEQRWQIDFSLSNHWQSSCGESWHPETSRAAFWAGNHLWFWPCSKRKSVFSRKRRRQALIPLQEGSSFMTIHLSFWLCSTSVCVESPE